MIFNLLKFAFAIVALIVSIAILAVQLWALPSVSHLPEAIDSHHGISTADSESISAVHFGIILPLFSAAFSFAMFSITYIKTGPFPLLKLVGRINLFLSVVTLIIWADFVYIFVRLMEHA